MTYAFFSYINVQYRVIKIQDSKMVVGLVAK